MSTYWKGQQHYLQLKNVSIGFMNSAANVEAGGGGFSNGIFRLGRKGAILLSESVQGFC